MPSVTLNDTEVLRTTMQQGSVATVPDGTITTAKLDDSAVTADKLADGAVTADKLASSLPSVAITNAEIDAIVSA